MQSSITFYIQNVFQHAYCKYLLCKPRLETHIKPYSALQKGFRGLGLNLFTFITFTHVPLLQLHFILL